MAETMETEPRSELDVGRERLTLLLRLRQVERERAAVEHADRLHFERPDSILRRERRLAPLRIPWSRPRNESYPGLQAIQLEGR